MKGGKLMLIVAICCGLVAAVSVYIYLGKTMTPAPATTTTVTVVAAKSAIPPRTKLTQDLIYVKEVPEEAAHPKVARDTADIVGLITKHEILEGEQIIMDRLYREDERIGLVTSVPQDMRAVTVPVDEVIGVAGFVKPGDRVDIIATASGVGQTGDVAFTALEDVEVLAVAQEMEDKSQGKAKVTTSVTLAVTPSEAEKLALAERIGKLRLALRPMFAGATGGQGIVAHDLLREVKGWSPPKSGLDSASARSSTLNGYSGEPPSGPAVVKPRTSSQDSKASGPGAVPEEGKAPSIVEVIRGSQTTYVTLIEGGEVAKP
ncbi:MAG TPA: Flp pilus assembly protein CpaB [Bacillota bacterium]|nr:Flp pilus assembly protein CpaB [Bacillota bacterium]